MYEEQKFYGKSYIYQKKSKSLLQNQQQTEADSAETQKLLSFIKFDECHINENPDLAIHLEEVFSKLRQLIKDWVKRVAIKKGVLPNIVLNTGGELYTCGSFRLGIYVANIDIDALCVVPNFVEREEHFLETL